MDVSRPSRHVNGQTSTVMKNIEKTALIIPPSPFLADERVFPFLGILKVASAMQQEGLPVDVVDLSGVANYEEVVNTYRQNNPDVRRYGITATTPQFPSAVRIAETIKTYDRESRVILGGAHATMVCSAYLLDRKKGVEHRGTQAYKQMVQTFDVSVIGDGERAIFAALEEEAPAVIDAGNPKSEHFLQRGTLGDYPLPARDLIDMASYRYQIDGQDAASMIAQLGCPFECGFCGGRNTPAFRIARTRPVDSIMGEVDELVMKYGKRGVMFYDDELNISNDSVMGLMEQLITYQEENNIELRLRGFVKAELFTREQAAMMHRAGFSVMLSGVESGDRGILDTMRKHTTPEINSQWVAYSREAGLKVKALMSIGHPGETQETVERSLQWVLRNRPDDVDWTIITQYPGSPYFDHSEPHPTTDGVWVYTNPRDGHVLFSQNVNFAQKAEYYKGVPGDYTSYVWTECLSAENLVTLRDRCETVSRSELALPTIQHSPALQFEHSMGMGTLPSNIVRSSI